MTYKRKQVYRVKIVQQKIDRKAFTRSFFQAMGDALEIYAMGVKQVSDMFKACGLVLKKDERGANDEQR